MPVGAAPFLHLMLCDLFALLLLTARHLLGDLVLYKSGRLEDRNDPLGYFNGITGVRVAGYALLALYNLESTETSDLNVLVRVEGLSYLIKETVDYRSNVLFIQIDIIASCYSSYDIGLCHSFPPLTD